MVAEVVPEQRPLFPEMTLLFTVQADKAEMAEAAVVEVALASPFLEVALAEDPVEPEALEAKAVTALLAVY